MREKDFYEVKDLVENGFFINKTAFYNFLARLRRETGKDPEWLIKVKRNRRWIILVEKRGFVEFMKKLWEKKKKGRKRKQKLTNKVETKIQKKTGVSEEKEGLNKEEDYTEMAIEF